MKGKISTHADPYPQWFENHKDFSRRRSILNDHYCSNMQADVSMYFFDCHAFDFGGISNFASSIYSKSNVLNLYFAQSTCIVVAGNLCTGIHRKLRETHTTLKYQETSKWTLALNAYSEKIEFLSNFHKQIT